MTKLSTAELEAIRERVEKATPGPWCHEINGVYSEHAESYDYSDENTKEVCSLSDGGEYISNINMRNDANFIAHAREDIPKLLAEIERLKVNLRNVQQELSNVTQLLDGAYEILHDDEWYRNHPLAVDIIQYFERG